VGGVLSQVFTAATMPVLSRIYNPLAYGVWAVFMSAALIVAAVATFRYELAVVLPEDHGDGLNLLLVGLLSTLAVSLLVLILLPFLCSVFLDRSLAAELHGWLWLLPLQVAAAGAFASLSAWLVRTQEFFWYSITQTFLPISSILAQICLGVLWTGSAIGLILGSVIGQVAALAWLSRTALKKIPFSDLQVLSWSKMAELSWKYRVYPIFMTPYTLVGALRERVVYLILGRFGSKGEAGYYSLSARLVNMPNSLLSSSLRPVFFQEASGRDYPRLEATVANVMKLMVIVVVPFWALFLFHAPSLFALFFGEPWREAGVYAAILSVPAIPSLLGNWLDRTFDVVGRQRLAFTLETIFAAVSITALLSGIWYFQSILVAVSMQSAVMTVYYLLWLAVVFKILRFRRSLSGRLLCLAVGWAAVSVLVDRILCVFLEEMYSVIAGALILFILVGSYLLKTEGGLFRFGMPGKKL